MVSHRLCKPYGTDEADLHDQVTNTDDFLIRMLKGCVQLSARPHIENSVNMVPVDRVASIVVASALMRLTPGVPVVHVDGHPRLHLHEYLGVMEDYGYRVPQVEYAVWQRRLEDYVSDGDENKPTNALYVCRRRRLGGCWMTG